MFGINTMSAVPSSYTCTQKARGLLMVFAAIFAALLCILFILTRNVVGVTAGVALAVFAFACIYAFVKGDTWSMSIEDGVLNWSYTRWPKSSGRIDLGTVRAAVVNDCGSILEITFADGSSQRLRLFGYAAKLRDYLVTNYPHIKVTFVEGM
jgi:hypothetical protein